MIRHATVVIAAFIVFIGFIGAPGQAKADFLSDVFGVPTSYAASGGCQGCGSPAPVYRYNTVNKVSNQVRYRDVRQNHYVQRNRYVYNVTRVRNIVRVHTVTRVHHYNIPVIRDVVVNKIVNLPTRYVSTGSVRNVYHGCGYR